MGLSLVLGLWAVIQSGSPSENSAICRALIQEISPEVRHEFVISHERAEQLQKLFSLSREQLMNQLVTAARTLARPPVSTYFVGAVGEDLSGNLYLGVNLEFAGFPLNQTVHGEQFVISQMFLKGAKGIRSIALSAAPCGHCRQFLNEVSGGENLRILIPQTEVMTLSQLLPKAFGPRELGWESQLLNSQPWNLRASRELDELEAAAFEWAKKSYAPHTFAPSGVALRVKDGRIFAGSYLETTAFNPSLSPLQVALTHFVSQGLDYSSIKEVVLVERDDARISQYAITKLMLKSIAPGAKLKKLKVNWDRWEKK